MGDAMWPCALIVVALLCWDAWRRWLARSHANWEQRLSELETEHRATRTDLGDLKATIGKHALAGTVGGPQGPRRMLR